MKLQTVVRASRNIVITLAALVDVGWLAFVPSAQEPLYQFVSAWGEKGSGPGQFKNPTGIAVADGEVFVSDSRNGRFKRQFGAPGIIQVFVYPDAYPTHDTWAVVLLYLMARGSGVLSVGHWLALRTKHACARTH